jgi:hypothetical protein
MVSCMDVGQLLALQEDIGSLVAGADAIWLELGVLGSKELIFLGEDLGAKEMGWSGGRVG